MTTKRFVIIALVMVFLMTAMIASAQKAEFPKAKDYMTGENVSPLILNRGTMPDTYLFPNDWVKKQNWADIRKKYGGTTLDIIFEGTDIGAPLMTKDHFEKLSGMKLNFTGVPNQVQLQKLLVSFATGTAAFDITVVATPNLPVFVRFLEPLDEWIKKYNYDFNNFVPHFQSLMTDTPLVPGGKVYGLPNDYDQNYWHCRKKFIDEIGYNGPPKDWNEVATYSQKLQKVLPSDIYPISFFMSRDLLGYEVFWDFAAGFGANYFKPGTWEPTYDSPEAMASANMQRDWIVKGYIHPGSTSWEYTRQLEAWNAGKSAMCIQYPIQESYHPKFSSIADEPRYHSPMPKGIGPKARHTTHGTFTNVALAMNKASKKKDAAFIYMAFCESSEVQYIYTVTGTGIDYGRKDIFASKIANTFYPNAEASWRTLPIIYNDVQIAPGPEILEAFTPYFHDIWTGKGKAEQLLPRANREIRDIMQKYGYLDKNPPVPAPKSFLNSDLYPETLNIKWQDGAGIYPTK